MPQNIILGPSTYRGKAALEIMGNAIMPKDLVEKYITVIGDIKGILKFQQADTTNVVGNYSPVFTPQNTSEFIFEKELQPKRFEVKKQYSLDVLRQDWLVEEIERGTKNDFKNKTFQDYIYKRTADKLSFDVQRLIWAGRSAVPSFANWTDGSTVLGLIERMRIVNNDIPANQKVDTASIAITGNANAINPIQSGNSVVASTVTFNVASSTGISQNTMVTVRGIGGGLGAILNGKNGVVVSFTATTIVVRFDEIDLTGAPAGLYTAISVLKFVNASNVLQVVRDFYAARPINHMFDNEFQLMISADIASWYKQVTVNQKIGHGETVAGDVKLAYLDMGMENVLYSLPPGTMLYARKKDLLIGADIFGEETQAEITDLSGTTGDHLVNVRMGAKIDMNYRMGSAITLLTSF